MQAHFRPVFHRQLTGSATAADDCGPVAARHAMLRWTLGARDLPIATIRSLMKLPKGQAMIGDQADVFSRFGANVAIFDRFDHFSVADLREHLARGGFAVCLGDYDEVPPNLKGDLQFNQNHFVMLNELNPPVPGGAPEGVLVYDSLDDGRIDRPSKTRRAPKGPIVWPFAVLEKYLKNLSDKFDNDITVAIFPRRRLRRRDPGAVNIRPTPSKARPPIGKWLSGELEHAGTVLGDPHNGDKRWFRVWWPEDAVVAFVHASVVLESTAS
ncbi:MAG: hypothetical protein L0221_09370 [Chloroflexi bacterium]|nr:hypothetical protein [Chloroflexota bacterium]